MTSFRIQTTKKDEMQLITRQVQDAVSRQGITEGICIVYCPHTTAGITINENADPDVVTDLLLALDKAYPDRPAFRHFEGNSAAHVKATTVGSSVTIPIHEGTLATGRWQGVWFCEFDGPRNREFTVQIVESRA